MSEPGLPGVGAALSPGASEPGRNGAGEPPRGEHPAKGVLHRALGWLADQRERFRPPPDAAERADPNTTVKPLGELGQLMAAVARRTEPADPAHATARALLDFAWSASGDGALFHALAHAEPHATYPLELYAGFTDAGFRHPGFEDFARVATATRGWRAGEREPTRTLAVLGAEHRLGLPPHRPPASVTAQTWLGGLPEPWAFERAAGYAATHHVFHVTGWGTDPGALPADTADYLTAWLPAWLGTCLEERLWDLAGELLAVSACLPEPLPAGPEWRAYAAAQAPDGRFVEHGPPPAAPAADASGFRRAYHPTLVAAFASALALGRVPAPPQTVGGAR
ncbi:hypothetical protein JJV70_16875 [Streptomyces sp. JJ66]|uniref:DUF6895 family protein n=1 Tax=Streptomyces sp. JJ66 TaxID=2803843 RepID=UPI001C57A325|nr:hypothetical protein [Streptomyces sp. JJ66]MBW1603751.1 hypothetical protein [Streptomyces sp. JJ66]